MRQNAYPTPGPGGKSRRRARQRPEKAIQRAILEFLKQVPGVVAWKSGAGAFRLSYRDRAGQTRERFVVMGKRGVSDIVGWQQCWVQAFDGEAWKPGARVDAATNSIARFLAIEVKRHGEPLTPEQAAFLEAVKQAGGIAVVARSVADVSAALGLAREG